MAFSPYSGILIEMESACAGLDAACLDARFPPATFSPEAGYFYPAQAKRGSYAAAASAKLGSV